MMQTVRLRGVVMACSLGVMLHGVCGGAASEGPGRGDLVMGHPSTKASPLTTLDIVVAIDNSSSMGPMISSLEDQLYDHFVALQIANNVDARVIIVSKHGNNASESVCFEEPLSSVAAGGCTNPPAQPGLTDIFKHYSVEVGSLDAWCLLMSTFDGTTPDDFSLAPTGWSGWLREGAVKVILVLSDDGVMCGSYDDDNSIAGGEGAAAAIDGDLLALSPLQFGTSSDRHFVVHSLVGLVANAVPDDPWLPTSPVTTSTCPGAISPGTGHQGLAVLTGGLRFPVCSTTDFDTFLEAVSQDTSNRFPLFADGFESADTGAWTSTVP